MRILNMFIHILMVIAYGGGLLYSLVLIEKRKRLGPDYQEHLDRYLERFLIKEPSLWMGYLGVIILTGFNFTAISLMFHGKLPEIAPIALGALGTMIILSFISLGFAYLLWKKMSPLKRIIAHDYPSADEVSLMDDLRQDRLGSVKRLLILALIIIFCAVTLRFMA